MLIYLYLPSQDLGAICGRSQWEHTEPPLIWAGRHNDKKLDKTIVAPLLNHRYTDRCMSPHTQRKLDEDMHHL